MNNDTIKSKGQTVLESTKHLIQIKIMKLFSSISATFENHYKLLTTSQELLITENAVVTTHKTVVQNEFPALYLLVGLGFIISLFLFIIAIQQCKKSNSSNMRTINRQPYGDDTIPAQSSSRQNGRGDGAFSDQFKADQSYMPLEFEYAVINERLEMQEANTSTERQQNGDDYLSPVFVAQI